jgi:DNA repair exonuclease SbcCD ATPase subunit
MTDKEKIKKLENIERLATKTIEKQEKEIEKQQYILMGVMHSVDKWLDGDELKQDEVNRAATMREKTLQITEKQQADIEKLNVELVGMRGACESYKMHYDKAQAEMERLQKVRANILKVMKENISQTKSEAIKEFAERLCEGRVSNDPVVIAVKAELKLTEVSE